MKKTIRRLPLQRETLRILTEREAAAVAGGGKCSETAITNHLCPSRDPQESCDSGCFVCEVSSV